MLQLLCSISPTFFFLTTHIIRTLDQYDTEMQITAAVCNVLRTAVLQYEYCCCRVYHTEYSVPGTKYSGVRSARVVKPRAELPLQRYCSYEQQVCCELVSAPLLSYDTAQYDTSTSSSPVYICSSTRRERSRMLDTWYSVIQVRVWNKKAHASPLHSVAPPSFSGNWSQRRGSWVSLKSLLAFARHKVSLLSC